MSAAFFDAMKCQKLVPYLFWVRKRVLVCPRGAARLTVATVVSVSTDAGASCYRFQTLCQIQWSCLCKGKTFDQQQGTLSMYVLYQRMLVIKPQVLVFAHDGACFCSWWASTEIFYLMFIVLMMKSTDICQKNTDINDHQYILWSAAQLVWAPTI